MEATNGAVEGLELECEQSMEGVQFVVVVTDPTEIILCGHGEGDVFVTEGRVVEYQRVVATSSIPDGGVSVDTDAPGTFDTGYRTDVLFHIERAPIGQNLDDKLFVSIYVVHGAFHPAG